MNDLLSTHSWVEKFLYDKLDGTKYTAGSNKIIKTVCPICGTIQDKRINKIVKNGFQCVTCSDNISYPNKLMYEILMQLEIDFEREKVFDWSDKKRYDFYIPSCNCIIEMNGSQHYQIGFNTNLAKTQSNDIYKKQLAIHEGLIEHYIEVDCIYSDCQYIYNNLCKNNLLKSIGIENINIINCDKKVREYSSIYKLVADLWNDGMTTTEIGKRLKYSKNTIGKILKQSQRIGLVNYEPRKDQNKKTKKKIIDLQTNTEYESILECSKHIGRARTFIKYHTERFIEKENSND